MLKASKKQMDVTAGWFFELRDRICSTFTSIELRYSSSGSAFEREAWTSETLDGGGEMSIMRGEVFEKVGVNVSTVYGTFSDEFKHEMPGTAQNDGQFWASGISLVAHMMSPYVPAVHMNTRFISTGKSWFGGGVDMTPTFEDREDTALFHNTLKLACDEVDESYYPRFKKQCDEYFYLKHRKEARGVGGIFFDYLQDEWDKHFELVKNVGLSVLDFFPKIIERNQDKLWAPDDKLKQMHKRGRYVEFNLLYDRGTRFGLMTGGNVDAIFMSLPPSANW